MVRCDVNDPSQWDVLIVDDEPDNVGVLELVLEFHNAHTRVASSGEECLQHMREQAPTFVLVDIQMPGMTGYELLKLIRANAAWRDIPVIAVTAHAMSGDEERIIRAGFDGYLAKPIDVVSLVDDLRAMLQAAEGK